MDDQISVTRQIAQQFDYIDPDRIGIWGWSYGGFNTAMTLERDTGSNPVFACGISGKKEVGNGAQIPILGKVPFFRFLYSSMASKPINILWIKTGSQPY